MKLTYRGVQYDYTAPLTDTQPTGDVGHYCGVDIRFRKTAKKLVHPLKVDLMYRGVPYTLGATTEQPVAAPAVSVSALTIADRLRSLVVAHKHDSQRRDQSMLNRLEAELGIG